MSTSVSSDPDTQLCIHTLSVSLCISTPETLLEKLFFAVAMETSHALWCTALCKGAIRIALWQMQAGGPAWLAQRRLDFTLRLASSLLLCAPAVLAPSIWMLRSPPNVTASSSLFHLIIVTAEEDVGVSQWSEVILSF